MIDEEYRGARIFTNPVNNAWYDRVRWNRAGFDWRTARFGVDYGFAPTAEAARADLDELTDALNSGGKNNTGGAA